MIQNPFVFHFYQDDHEYAQFESIQRAENVASWQKLTSTNIGADAIEAGVYSFSLKGLAEAFGSSNPSNSFIKWINEHKATDLKEYLLLAKELEELRFNRVSAWYYPSDKSGFDQSKSEKEKFDAILAKCREHQSGRLSDRYALQAIRALISLGEYQQCIDYYNKCLKFRPDSNLFKQMAKGYIGGCLSRLGEIEEADRLFAEVGDFNSIRVKDHLEVIAKYNPESSVLKSRLNGFIGCGDDESNRKYLLMADAALSSSKVKHRGDWLYLKAFIEEIYNHNTNRALSLVRQARNATFSYSEMSNDARFFEICLRAEAGDIVNYQANALWMFEEYKNNEGVWFYIIPALLKKGMKSEALLLANYNTANHPKPYANIGFQALLSMKAADVVAYKNMLKRPANKLIRKLKKTVNADDDYLNEIIGTLYLREENYSAAEKYLSGISAGYQKSMNIYKYLTYDPWTYYYTPDDKWYYSSFNWDDYEYYYEVVEEYGHSNRPAIEKSKVRQTWNPNNAKYNFAKAMSALKAEMTKGATADARGMARLKYAIGRYNSLNTCWAYTQYWVGTSDQSFYLPFYFWDGETRKLDYIIDTPRQLDNIDQWFEKEVLAALEQMESEEALANANLILRNYRTIARHYPNSAAGKYLSAHCDAWNNWL